MGLAYPEIAFTYVIAAFGFVYGLALLIFYSKLRNNPEMMMARFKLNKDKTVRDFKFLLISNVGLALSMAMLVYGSSADMSLILNLSYVSQVLFAALAVSTIGTWVIDYVL